MKTVFSCCKVFLLAIAILFSGSGCISIPMETETFENKRPTIIKESGPATVSRVTVKPVLTQLEEDPWKMSISLSGTIVMETPREQHFESVEIGKTKKMAIGIWPGMAEWPLDSAGKLTPTIGASYEGNGLYKFAGGAGPEPLGGILATPYSLLFAWFDKYECSSHHWIEKDTVGSTARKTQYKNDVLTRFSDEERKKIGAWTWHDISEHRQSVGSVWIHSGLVGCHKYCVYSVNISDKSEPAEPKRVSTIHEVPGPFKVRLSIPELGYKETLPVPKWKMAVTFDLSPVSMKADGRLEVDGIVSIFMNDNELLASRTDPERLILERAMKNGWKVKVRLPLTDVSEAREQESVSAGS